MKKLFLILLILFFASPVMAMPQAGYGPGDDIEAGSVSVGTVTVTAAGPTDNVDVTNVCIVKVDTSSNNVTIGGFVGGRDGQSISVYVIDSTNNCTLENAESTGNQDIYLESGGDETKTASYGGWVLTCDGSNWYQTGGSLDTSAALSNDSVKDTHIDWGTGAGQVSADDIGDGSSNAIPTLTQESNWDTAYGWGDHAGSYEPADAAIVKSDEAETLSANWDNTANPWAVNEGGTGLSTLAAWPIGDTAFTDLDKGDTYSNFSTSADDDTINELFAALDTAIGGLGSGHDALTLGASLSSIFSLTDQELGLTAWPTFNQNTTGNAATATAAAAQAITDNAILTVDDADAGAGQVAMFTANGIEGKSTLGIAMYSSTSHTANAVGEFDIDTDGDGSTVTQGVFGVHDGTQLGYYFPVDAYPTADNQIQKYDANTHKLVWEADETGSGSLGSNLSSTTNDITTDNNVIQLIGNSEDLDIEFSENSVDITTDTGVTEIDLIGIDLKDDGSAFVTVAALDDTPEDDGDKAASSKAVYDERAATVTLTNKTIDGDDNTLSDIGYGSIKSTSRSGSDATLVTGTKGDADDLVIWDANGDAVGSGSTVAELEAAARVLDDDESFAILGTADGMATSKYNGITVNGLDVGEDVDFLEVVFINNDTDPIHLADATAASGEYPAFGISVSTGTVTDTNPVNILTQGVIRYDTWDWTPGAAIYLGETDGTLTSTAPSTSNDCIQIIGWAISDDEIYFDFSRPYQLVE